MPDRLSTLFLRSPFLESQNQIIPGKTQVFRRNLSTEGDYRGMKDDFENYPDLGHGESARTADQVSILARTKPIRPTGQVQAGLTGRQDQLQRHNLKNYRGW